MSTVKLSAKDDTQRLDALLSAMDALSIDGKPHAQTLLAYLDRLLLWNKTYNLTAITDKNTALVKHIIDCLAVVHHLPSGTLLDVGTGAGLPAFVIALLRDDICVSAIDTNQKKVRFLSQTAHDLGVQLNTIHGRIENHHARYDMVISRAFTQSDVFWALCQKNIQDDGALYYMAGQRIQGAMALVVPFLDEARHLLILQKDKA